MPFDRRSFLLQTGKLLVHDSTSRRGMGLRDRRRAREGARLRCRRALVGHDHRRRAVHRLWQVRPGLQGGKRRLARSGLLPHLGGAVRDRSRRSGASARDSPNGGYDGFPEPTTQAGVKTFFVPKMCNHCADSPCIQVCPVGATFLTPDGVVLVDKEYCLGCRYCVQACPYGCRYIDPETHTADKCTLCYHRITKGLQTGMLSRSVRLARGIWATSRIRTTRFMNSCGRTRCRC